MAKPCGSILVAFEIINGVFIIWVNVEVQGGFINHEILGAKLIEHGLFILRAGHVAEMLTAGIAYIHVVHITYPPFRRQFPSQVPKNGL